MRHLKAPMTLYDRGKPVAVQFDMETYREILARLADYEDVRELEEMRQRPLEFHSLEDVLDEFEVRV